MAKGNMLQGQATGKVGDIVFMVRNGQQISRVYTSAGGRSGDQASIAVRRQRVRFGAASNQYLLYRNIVRGMYRTGKSTKQSDYNFFVRENVDLLPYLTKEENAAGVKCAMPGTFSRGTLGNLAQKIKILAVGETDSIFLVQSASQRIASSFDWTDKVDDLKAALKLAFPNARKVNYSLASIVKSVLDTPSGSVYSHNFDRADVTFDLFEEDPGIADSSTIAEYFNYFASGTALSGIFTSFEGTFCGNEVLFSVSTTDGITADAVHLLYCVVFATNDQVGDCYTTNLTEIDVAQDNGGLSLYDTLRTDNHRQVAEDSYGYATGVMRTNIQQA